MPDFDRPVVRGLNSDRAQFPLGGLYRCGEIHASELQLLLLPLTCILFIRSTPVDDMGLLEAV